MAIASYVGRILAMPSQNTYSLASSYILPSHDYTRTTCKYHLSVGTLKFWAVLDISPHFGDYII